MSPHTYTCEMCGGTFESENDDAAQAEVRALFPDDLDDLAEVCDVCYRHLMELAGAA